MYRRLILSMSVIVLSLFACSVMAQVKLDFGTVAVGKSVEMKLIRKVAGSTGIMPFACREGVVVTGWHITGKDKNDFTIVKDAIKGTFTQGQESTATVRFTPSHKGPASAQFVLEAHPVNPKCGLIITDCDFLGNQDVNVTPQTNFPEPDTFSVRDIPTIMRNIALKANNKGFDVAADMQDKWFNGQATSEKVQGEEQNVVRGIDWKLARNKDTIYYVDMDWITKYSNSTDVDGKNSNDYVKVYSKLALKSYLFTDASVKVLKEHILRSRLYNAGAKAIKFPFNVLGKHQYVTEQIHAEQIQYSAFSGYPPLNPLGMTLGECSFYAIPIGKAFVKNKTMHIECDSVGIYMTKGFRFHTHGLRIDKNFLGSWGKPDKVGVTPFGKGLHPIVEKDYIKWRKENNRGNDFVIISDIKVIPLSSKFEIDIPLN